MFCLEIHRHDSTIPIPYYKWAYYDPNVKELPQTINYAANKTKKVAWLVSNCELLNDRLAYGHALQKYIQVSIQINIFIFSYKCSKISIIIWLD